MVEGTGLENRRTGNGIVSSNLTLPVQRAAGPGNWHVSALGGGRAPAARLMIVGRSFVGSVAEWFKAHAWKVCVRESVP